MAKVQLLPWLWGVAGAAVLVAMFLVTPLTLAGWLAGVTYVLVSSLLLSLGLTRRGMTQVGPANAATATRSLLVGVITSFVVTSFTQPIPVPLLTVLAAAALLLDGVDGWLARRFGSESALGARFDMEVDAFLMLVLSVYDARSLGWWIVVIGLMRYAYVAVGWVLPWLRGQLPPRYWRKVVTAVCGIALTVAATGWVTALVGQLVLGVALALLVESFGRDVIWLFRRRRLDCNDLPMTNTAPLPEPNYVPGGIDSEQDLRVGADNGPDILQGIAEDEPDLESVIKHDDVPFRRPVAGERLSEEQLERDND